jgi:hypothetical protein
MMSINMSLVNDWALTYDHSLLATDKGFRNSVSVIHEEGSTFFIRSAFLILVQLETKSYSNNKFVVCFSEHQGHFIWAEDELLSYKQMGPLKIKKTKLKLVK